MEQRLTAVGDLARLGQVQAAALALAAWPRRFGLEAWASGRSQTRHGWPWVKTNGETRIKAILRCNSKPMLPFWGFQCITRFRTYFSGWIGMFIRGTIWVLTHGQVTLGGFLAKERCRLGPPARCPFSPKFCGREGSPTKIDCRKKGYPYSNLSTGGPSKE